MDDDNEPNVNLAKYDEAQYLAANPDAQSAVEGGKFRNGYEHYLRHGIDENRRPRRRRAAAPLSGALEQTFVSESGFFLILGWLADEGQAPAHLKLVGEDFSVEIPPNSVLRHARKEIETKLGERAFDFGFLAFGKCPSRLLLQQAFQVQADSETGSFEALAAPDIVADKRLLDKLLSFVATSRSHAGAEAGLHVFLASAAGGAVVDLFAGHVAANAAAPYVRSFRPRPVSRSFVTVVFGSIDAILMQPVLFRRQDIDFGEWIYVCNSPDDADAALRLGRMVSDLYDVMITVIVMSDNVGFGAANNVAVARASGDSIYLINPDVFPLAAYSEIVRETLRDRELGRRLWGGLLFYDDQNLMHSGMYIEWDSVIHFSSFSKPLGSTQRCFELARVEHFDKCVPFEEGRWSAPKVVPAVTGALMAFRKPYFERIGGFSTRYIYGHYEDADLSLRWAESNGPVVVDNGLRLIHLEGLGSRRGGEIYRGASMINRYLFSLEHGRSPRAGAAGRTSPADPSFFQE